MIDTIIKAIQERLMTLYPTPIRYVAEDWGQIDFYDTRPAVSFPCALLDIAEESFADAGGRMQHAQALLTVRVANNPPINRSATDPQAGEQYALLDVTQQVYRALQGFAGDEFGTLSRVSLKHIKRDDQIKEYELTFRFGYSDTSAIKTPKTISGVTSGVKVTIS